MIVTVSVGMVYIEVDDDDMTQAEAEALITKLIDKASEEFNKIANSGRAVDSRLN